MDGGGRLEAPGSGLALLTEQIAALLAHNGIGTPAEAFPLFDNDGDDRISVADLFASCEELNLAASREEVTQWISSHAHLCHQPDLSYVTLDTWSTALRHADGARVLEELGRATSLLSAAGDPQSVQEQKGPVHEDAELHRQLQAADELLAASKVHGSLQIDDEEEYSSDSSVSTVSSPEESAGGADSFELERATTDSSVGAAWTQYEKAPTEQGRRSETVDVRSSSHMADEEMVKRQRRQDEAAARIQARHRGIITRHRIKQTHGFSASLTHSLSLSLGMTSESLPHVHADFEEYDDEFEEDEPPRWVGGTHDVDRQSETAEVHQRTDGHSPDGEPHVPSGNAMGKDTADDVLSVQIGMLEADWAGSIRHQTVRKYATDRLAREVVLDLVERVSVEQEVRAEKRKRVQKKREEEATRGYHKPRIVEAITAHIKNAQIEELRAREQMFHETNRWYRERGKRLRALQKEEKHADWIQIQREADWVARRRAKTEELYQEKDAKIARNRERVSFLRESRARHSMSLGAYVLTCKAQEEEAQKEELRAQMVIDAQRRDQMMRAKAHSDKMGRERKKLHDLGVAAARRRVLREAKAEREFKQCALLLEQRKKKRAMQRAKKREEIMAVYESSLQAADSMKKTDSIGESGGKYAGRKDQNDTLKTAVGVYFADPARGAVLAKTKKMMGSLLFEQKVGEVAWTKKRVEARLREIFRRADKDATGYVEASELHMAMERMGGNVSLEDIKQLLKGFDLGGDGQLTIEKFVTLGQTLFDQHTGVSGEKLLVSRPGTSLSNQSAATPEKIISNRNERDARRAAAQKVINQQQEEKLQKMAAQKAKYAARTKFLHQAILAHGKDITVKVGEEEERDKETGPMSQKVDPGHQRKKQGQEKRRDEKVKCDEREQRVLQPKQDGKYTKAKERASTMQKTFREAVTYEKSITAEYLVNTVQGPRRMASPGYPVVVAPRESATDVMRQISSVYLSRPRQLAAGSTGSQRPHTSIGFRLDHASDISRPSSSSSLQNGAQSAGSGTEAKRLRLGSMDEEKANEYFIMFGSTTKLGVKTMPYIRFYRMLVTLNIVPSLLLESDASKIFDLSRGKDGWDDVSSRNLTQQQFRRAIFHVSEWTGRNFFELALQSEQTQASHTNKVDWTSCLRSSLNANPFQSRADEMFKSASLSSSAQISLPVVGFFEKPSTPVVGVRAPRTKKEYLQIRRHMKIASYKSVRAQGELPAGFRKDYGQILESPDAEEASTADNAETKLPSVSPDFASSSSSIFGASIIGVETSFSTVADRSLDTGDLIVPSTAGELNLSAIEAEQPASVGGEGQRSLGSTSTKPFKFRLGKK